MHRKKSRIRGEGGIRTLLAIAFFAAIAAACFKIVPVHIQGNEVKDAMDEAANFGGLKAAEKLQYEIFKKAQDAGAPLPLQDIKISRRGAMIVIEAKYTRKVDVFGYEYVYNFSETVEKQTF